MWGQYLKDSWIGGGLCYENPSRKSGERKIIAESTFPLPKREVDLAMYHTTHHTHNQE